MRKLKRSNLKKDKFEDGSEEENRNTGNSEDARSENDDSGKENLETGQFGKGTSEKDNYEQDNSEI